MKKQNVNQFIDTESKTLIQNAVNLGENHAENNLPKASDPSMKLYVQTIAKDFERLWRNIVSTYLDAESTYELGEIQHSQNKNEAKMKENDYTLIKHDRDKVKQELQQFPKVVNWKIVLGVICAFVAYVGVESLFNSSFIQMIMKDLSYNVAIIIGVFFYILMFFAILHFEKKIKEASSPQKKKLYRAIFYGIMLSFIGFTSYARTLFTNKGEFSGLIFIGFVSLNVLMFIGLLFMHQFVPSREEIQDLLDYRKIETKLNRLNEKLESLKSEIDKKKVDNMNLVKETKSSMLAIERHKEYLISQYELAVSSYMEINIKLRPDKLIPNCFSQNDIPSLNL